MLLSKEPESKLRGLGGAYRYPFQLLDFAIVVLETVSKQWVWLCSNKTLLIKTDLGSDVTPGMYFINSHFK